MVRYRLTRIRGELAIVRLEWANIGWIGKRITSGMFDDEIYALWERLSE
jgi:hypothetical protein